MGTGATVITPRSSPQLPRSPLPRHTLQLSEVDVSGAMGPALFFQRRRAGPTDTKRRAADLPRMQTATPSTDPGVTLLGSVTARPPKRRTTAANATAG